MTSRHAPRLSLVLALVPCLAWASWARAQDGRPPTVQEAYGGPAPGVHEGIPPAPEDYASDDPFADPNHPLKGSRDPGPGWDEAVSGRDVATWSRPADWDWKELHYSGTYPTALRVSNRCATPEPVYITHDLPYLEIQPTAVIPPGGVDVPATIRTPPPPPPPVGTPAPDQPGYGWVEPPHWDPATGTSTRRPGEPEFHQPNFELVEGTVKVWHPWREPCLASRRVWAVTGHVHFRPPPPEAGDEGPREIAAPDPCVAYWNLGEPPPGFDDRDCTDVWRGLAIDLVTRILAGLVEEDPGAWAWLPSVEAIRSMGPEDLIAIARRADDQLAGAAGDT